MERSQFTFYRSYLEGISRIRSKSARCDAYDAIVRYALDGTVPDTDAMPDAAALAFIMAKPTLDTSRRKAEGGSWKRDKLAVDDSKIIERPSEDSGKISERPDQLDIDIDRDIGLMSEEGEEDPAEKRSFKPILDAWNSIGLTTIKRISSNSTRYRNLTARIHEHGEDEVVKAIKSIEKSSFLRGDNDRGWVITFDWFLKPSNFQKVAEGNYVDRLKKGYDPKFYGDHSKPILTADGKTLYQQLLEEEQEVEA